MTAIHRHVSEIHTTIIDIAATKDTTCVIKAFVFLEVSVFILVCIVFYLLLISFIDIGRISIVCTILIIYVTNIAVVQRNVGGAPDCTAFSATVGITLNVRNAMV